MAKPNPAPAPPFGLYIRSHKAHAFDIAESLGFENEIDVMAVSIFEDSADTMAIQALFETQDQAMACFNAREFDKAMESFVAQLPDEDWVSLSQQGLPPISAGRFFIYGAHDTDKIPADCLYPIQIEAGLAFGTGHHATTQGCLRLFDDLLQQKIQPKHILDLGCGAGILAIAAAKTLGAELNSNILATDIDPDAVYVTRDNAALNHVNALIQAEIADGFDTPILKGKSFDLIFANILAGPLIGLAPQIAKALSPNGQAILSGILDEQARAVLQAFEAEGLNAVPQPSLAGWTSVLINR